MFPRWWWWVFSISENLLKHSVLCKSCYSITNGDKRWDCTDFGCSLEQEVLITGTTADRTTSSIRGLRRPDDSSPATQKPGRSLLEKEQKLSRLSISSGGAAHPAELLGGPTTAGAGRWSHESTALPPPCPGPALLSSGGCDTPAPPPPRKNQRCLQTGTLLCEHLLIKANSHFEFCTKGKHVVYLPLRGTLPVCAELSTSRRTGVLSWTTLGRTDTAARADKHRWRTAWWECSPEGLLLLSLCSIGSEKTG